MTVIIYIHIYGRSRLRENRTAENIEKQKIRCPIFLDYLSFLWKSHLCISYRVAVNWLLLLSIYNVRGCVSAKQLQISKNAEIGVQYFLIIYLFVTDIQLYLLQGGRKTAFVENIYIRSRLREGQTA